MFFIKCILAKFNLLIYKCKIFHWLHSYFSQQDHKSGSIVFTWCFKFFNLNLPHAKNWTWREFWFLNSMSNQLDLLIRVLSGHSINALSKMYKLSRSTLLPIPRPTCCSTGLVPPSCPSGSDDCPEPHDFPSVPLILSCLSSLTQLLNVLHPHRAYSTWKAIIQW